MGKNKTKYGPLLLGKLPKEQKSTWNRLKLSKEHNNIDLDNEREEKSEKIMLINIVRYDGINEFW